MTDLEAIKSTLVSISKGEGLLEMLMEFERTLDNAEIFAYKNWILGELVEGPTVNRYWFKTVWMYPYAMMPDPDAGLRLTKLGARVNFKKGVFKKPVKVRGPEDWQDPETKRAKMAEHEIWLVTIDMPIKYIQRGIENIDQIIAKDIQKASEELADAFEEQDLEAAPVESMEDMGDGTDGAMDLTGEEGQP